MNFEVLIPISLFIAIAYTIKAVMDARVRRQMIDSNGSQDLVRAMLQGEELRQRQGSLRWGITFTALALGFGLVEAGGWNDVTPGVIAVLLGAIGLGNLAFYGLSRRMA
jgi:hypothetical protein